MLLNRTLKMVEMTNFMLCIFCYNKKNTFCLWGSPQYCGWFESWWSEWVDSKWTSGCLAHRLEGICGINLGVYSQWRSVWCQVRRGHLRPVTSLTKRPNQRWMTSRQPANRTRAMVPEAREVKGHLNQTSQPFSVTIRGYKKLYHSYLWYYLKRRKGEGANEKHFYLRRLSNS